MERIPMNIIQLAVEATSNHNDGWTKQGARDQLRAIKEYIKRILGENPIEEVKDESKF